MDTNHKWIAIAVGLSVYSFGVTLQVHKLLDELVETKVELANARNGAEWYRDIIRRQHEEEENRAKAKQHHDDFIKAEIKCLADNIANEAAREPENGQLAVGTVTMNRVAALGYPKTVCGVVEERHINPVNGKIVCQFTWQCRPPVVFKPSVYGPILKMARAIYLKHERSEEVPGALLYHAVYINPPNWATDDAKLATIGLHTFYSK